MAVYSAWMLAAGMGPSTYDKYLQSQGKTREDGTKPSEEWADRESWEKVTKLLADYKTDANKEATKRDMAMFKSSLDFAESRNDLYAKLRETNASNARTQVIAAQRDLEARIKAIENYGNTRSAANDAALARAIKKKSM